MCSRSAKDIGTADRSTELEDSLSADDAETTLRTIINWGRYAELFSYDDRTRTFIVGASPDLAAG